MLSFFMGIALDRTVMTIIGVLVVILLILVSCIHIVPQSKSYIVERLGAYHSTWNVGFHVKVPFIDKISNRISLKERVYDFPPQPVITKDNVTMMIDTVVYLQITDPKLYTYGVESPNMALENLSATTLRNIIGDLELDDTLTSRDIINSKMRSILDEATDPWGIKVNRVEVKNIVPPEAIRVAMEKQMRAERERREAILIAEGKKQSSILVSEGEKQSKILEAEANKTAMILKAEAEKEASIRRAEGEAEAIRQVQEAKAMGFKMLKDAGVDDSVLKIRSLEAFEKVADGNSVKLIIPSDMQSMAGVVASVTEIARQQKDSEKG